MPNSSSRRAILRLGVAAGLVTPAALYAQHDHGQPAPAAGRGQNPGADHDHDHGSTTAAAEPEYTGSRKLAPLSTLPSGQPLPPLPKLANTSKERGKFAAALTAAPHSVEWVKGQPTQTWAYNGSLPGPLIDVTEGDRIDIRFNNKLAEESTIHWHGVPTPADQDGNPPDVVAAGKERHYGYLLPAGSSGTHWYHPHPHERTGAQVLRGLAGAFIVRPQNDPLAHLPEQNLFISDLRLADDGNIPPNTRMDWMNGREGQFVLINGAYQPRIAVGGTQRWRIWNACSARYLRLSLGGLPFTLAGTDGGLLAAPVDGLTELLLTPAQRVEIIVHPPQDGAARNVELQALPYNRGGMGPATRPQPPRVLATVNFAARGKRLAVPQQLRSIEPLGQPTAYHRVLMTELMDMDTMRATPGGPYSKFRGLYFLLNGQRYDMKRIDINAEVNAVEQWEVTNLSSMGMDHPFHVHGDPFQVIEREFEGKRTPEPLLAWRDTVNIRAGETVRFKMVQKHVGLRMFHCHILEHEDLGMMGNLMVKA